METSDAPRPASPSLPPPPTCGRDTSGDMGPSAVAWLRSRGATGVLGATGSEAGGRTAAGTADTPLAR